MQIIKLLTVSLLIFSLNVNLSATSSGVSHESAVRAISSSVDSDTSTDPDADNILNSKANKLLVDEFIKTLFSAPSLYVKWLTALEASIRNDDNFVSMDDFLINNGCSSCTYLDVVQAIEVKKSKYLFFWTGSYHTNLTSDSGTGKKLNLVIDEYIKVRHNKVVGIPLKIDGKTVFGAKFKDYKLTWDYGTNMQPNHSRGSITFAEVFLNGSYIGHQFTGEIVRQTGVTGGRELESFVGFTNVLKSSLVKNMGGDTGDGSGGSDDETDTEIDTDTETDTDSGDNGSGGNNEGVIVKVLDDTTSETGGTAKFSIVLDTEPVFGPTALIEPATGENFLIVAYYISDDTEGKFKGRQADFAFNKDNWNTPFEVTVYGQNDHKTDGNQSYQVEFSLDGGYDTNYEGVVIDPITLTNIETAGVTVKVLDDTTSEVGGTAKFSIVLNYEPIITNPKTVLHKQDAAGTPVTIIGIETSDPSEGKFANGIVGTGAAFTKDDWHIPKEYTIYGQNDDLGDGDKVYQIKFSASNGNAQGTNYAGLIIDPIDLTNIDEEDVNPITGKPQMSVGFVDYPAKKFGTQIWTTENMRHYPSKVGSGFWSGFDDNEDEFKFYNWNAAMNGETQEGAQGICATGWHVPTDGDWKTLEAFLGMEADMLDKDNVYRGTDQGAQLLAGGSSGFNAQLVGYHANAKIKDQGVGTRFISSTNRGDRDNAEFISRYIGEHRNPVRYILLKQSSALREIWSFSEIEAMVGSTNVALGASVSLSGSNLHTVMWGFFSDSDTSDAVNRAVETHASTAFTGYSNDSEAVFFLNHPNVTGISSLTDGSSMVGLSYGRTDSDFKNRFGNGLTIKPNGWLKIDLGASYLLDSVNIKEFAPNASNAPFAVSQSFTGNKIAVFTSQDDIDGTQTMTQLGLDSSVALKIGSVAEDSNSSQSISIPSPHVSTFQNTPNASKTIWRGAGEKKVGSLVRCVKSSGDDTSISAHTLKKITLKVGKPMTPIGFGDTVTSVTKNWSITPALDNGLVFDTTTGILSGTPLVAKEATDYQVRTTDDSKAVSPISITVIDGAVLVDSIQITGKHILEVGEVVQFSAMIGPSYASNKDVVWSIVGDDSKATIKQTGELTALKSGYVEVFAVAADGSASYDTFYVAIATQEQITFRGKQYSAITSNKTGRIWLDKNLGASQVCDSITDTLCYGDLYQWGREADGHQIRSPDPVFSSTQATKLRSNDGKFIGSRDGSHYDWVVLGVDDSGDKRKKIWMGSGSQRICPIGFTLPTIDELQTERQTAESNLKLPLNGWRNDRSGQVENMGTFAIYWTQEYGNTPTLRSKGMGVRCVKQQRPLIDSSVSTLTAVVGTAIAPITFANMGSAITQWEITPALPIGLTFDTKTGVISGTPNENMPATYYHITASNTSGVDTAWVRITVKPELAIIVNIEIIAPAVIINPYDAIQLNVIIDPSNADNSISWSSSNTNMATVDDTGLVTGLRHGTATIIARSKSNPSVVDSVRITIADYNINNKPYNAATSPETGRVWLDRNLGASRVCESDADMECYGDLYQFGRAGDGHQKRLNRRFKKTQTSAITPKTQEFVITGKDWTSADPSGDLRNAAWAYTQSVAEASGLAIVRDGNQVYTGSNNICPLGFSIPTKQELLNENIHLNSTVFENFLKLPVAGKRIGEDGSIVDVGVSGYYWSRTTAADSKAQSLQLSNNTVSFNDYYRNQGSSVRCIQSLQQKSHKYRYNRVLMEVSGIKYKTIAIGNQVWTAENMRHGTNSIANGIYSYDGQKSNDALYGKYYTFSAAMKGKNNVQGTQGICAVGWHIPTEEEWASLEVYLGMITHERGKQWAWRGIRGRKLKRGGGNGFNVVMSGRIRDNISVFKDKEVSFWTSNAIASTNNILFRSLKTSSTGIYKGALADSSINALSVRCIKNPLPPMEIAGIRYKTVEIGQQVWTAENMRHNVTSGNVFDYGNIDYVDSHGKLYNWEAAMNGSKIEGSQGMCAPGWHIPTEGDWKTLEGHLSMSKVSQNKYWAWRGLDQGTALKRGGGGFNALMSGRIKENMSTDRDKETSFWSSSEYVVDTIPLISFRSLKDSSSRIYKGVAGADIYGFSVRCIED